MLASWTAWDEIELEEAVVEGVATVLVVEDDVDARFLAATLLNGAGHRVLEAADGPSALTAWTTARPDLILLDLGLPGMGGYQVLAALADVDAFEETSVVVLTGASDTGSVVRALRAGAIDHVAKPYAPRELLARVEVALAAKRTRDALKVQVEALTELSATDPLTGLANRLAGEAALSQAVASSVERRTLARQASVAVAILDVDGFKALNDENGHAVGDLALRKIGELITAQLRRGDLAVRWGGDEFVSILPDCELDGARDVAERIRAAVDGTTLIVDGRVLRMTVSVGVAAGAVDDATALFALADAALYDAKRGGRNRVALRSA